MTTKQKRWLRRLEIAVRPGDLDGLARYYGTDKASWAEPIGHNYTPHYQHHLGPRRRQVRSVLEIGVGGTSSVEGYDTPAGGQSLRMWRRYFPNAKIVGVDIHHKTITGRRIRFEQGTVTNPEFLRRVVASHGPFDVIVDDGSHIGRDITAAFGVLWDAVQPGGFYAIEDLALAYHPDWEGGPPGTSGTVVELLKRLVDDTLVRAGEPFRPSVAAMHVYSEIAFLERVG